MRLHAVWKIAAPSLGLVLLVFVTFVVPHRWCAREADAWYAGDQDLQARLTAGIEAWLDQGIALSDYRTGSGQFNGEWLFGTYLMAGLGLGQSALEHHEWKSRHIPLMEICIDRLLDPDVREFDRQMWNNDPIETLDQTDPHHAAYLGYFNILLGLHRSLVTDSKYTALSDRITETLARRLDSSRLLLLQSYPYEYYPVDNCAVIGSIGLYDRVTGRDHSALLKRWSAHCRTHLIDPKTGLLIQAISPGGLAGDDPRGPGTSLGLYFLSFADMDLSRDLYRAVKRELACTVLGFGAVREYPRTLKGGTGDIDSGPVIFGLGFSATGFTLAGSRIHRDPDFFRRLVATTHFAGAPLDRNHQRAYVTGGPLGTAILYALFTAAPGGFKVPVS